MTFKDILAQVIDWLQQDKYLSYRALQRQFNLDEAYLDDLKLELIEVKHVAVDQGGRMLIWTGDPAEPEPDAQRRAEAESRFHALLPEVLGLLQRERRVTYRRLTYVFGLSEALLAAIRQELTFRQIARDEQGEGLVWIGDTQPAGQPAVGVPSQSALADMPAVSSSDNPSLLLPASETGAPVNGPAAISEPVNTPEPARPASEAERRQLTVMFCDLADSTKLSQQLDPEDLREVIRAYQQTSAAVIQQYDGTIAQHLGDGLLIYFGWPVAHEDDAPRALHAGLGIVEAIMTRLNPRLQRDQGVQLTVRIGIHTGPVVVGEMGGGGRQEHLATGETVNIAARLEGLAAPNTVVISQATARLVEGTFALQDLGAQSLKGVAEPMLVFGVRGPHNARDDDTPMSSGAPFLVGRDEEVGLLRRCWEQSKEGLGQAVLISGTAGIGKSSLVETLRARVRVESLPRTAIRCSSYHQNSALYPVITHVERLLDLQREDTPAAKLDKLEQGLRNYSLPLDEVVPLFASLLSVSLDGRYATPTLTPQQQKQQTLDALVAWMLEAAEQQPVLVAWEDLHWADPSTLELLGLLLEQTPTVPMLHVLTSRPEFTLPWPMRSHMTPITLNRLERPQVEALIMHLAHGKGLPEEVVEHIVVKTDGVPLYVEELTKMLLESDLLQEKAEQYVLTGPLLSVAIPDTLQDSLMARLDQLNTAKEVAQLGAVLGREFPYALIQAISSQDDETLQAGLAQLVEAELLYQRGRPPRAKYLFKHALIQDAAYASLLKRTRQRVHQRIAQVLVEQFPETVETQPEVVAHHYQIAGSTQLAIRYWQQAGERAIQRSANTEAIRQLAQAIDMLAELPPTAERHEQELDLQMAISAPLLAIKGFAAPELEAANTRARELCEMIGQTPKIIPALSMLMRYYNVIGQYQHAFEVSQEAYRILQRAADVDPAWTSIVFNAVGATALFLGDYDTALRYEQYGVAHSDVAYRDTQILAFGEDMGTTCRAFLALAQWCLGFPDQACATFQQARDHAEQFSHAFGIAWANTYSLILDVHCADATSVRQRAASTHDYAVEHGLPAFPPICRFMQGWARAMQDRDMAGVMQMDQALATFNATRYNIWSSFFHGLLAEAHQAVEQTAEAVRGIDAALEIANRSEEGYGLAEIHRLKGCMLLQQGGEDAICRAEACFHQALDIARRQHAKSWELRAATSLARLWQSQGKRQEAHDLLAPVYGWFTEGFDTADLQEAKVFLEELGEPFGPHHRE
jgi:class 3 adenylate cyclase/tetratricopeptide (TPR) repeat protein